MLVVLVAGACYAGAVSAGRASFELCQSCHGACGQGNIELNAPRLPGLDAAYVERQLLDFRTGRRGANAADVLGGQMAQMAKTLPDDAAVASVAAYIAALPLTRQPATLKGNVTAGRTLFATCAACHGAAAEGNRALGAPRLADSDDWYLLRQLEGFRAGWRGIGPADSPPARMRAIAMTLNGKESMRDVIAYIDSIAAAPAVTAATKCGP